MGIKRSLHGIKVYYCRFLRISTYSAYFFLAAAEAGDSMAQLIVGTSATPRNIKWIETGMLLSIIQSINPLCILLSLAAGRGFPKAQQHLGEMYRDGRGGFNQDPLKAFEWTQKGMLS
jgi:TPR repeat protein